MHQRRRIPGFTAEIALERGTLFASGRTGLSGKRHAGPPVRPADCSYYYGSCAGPRELSCELGDTGGICVGEGYAPVVVTCDGRASYTEAWCGA